MCARVVVVMQPFIQISLQRVDAVIELLTKRDLIKLLWDCLVEPLANTVGPGGFHLGLGVINVIRACRVKLNSPDPTRSNRLEALIHAKTAHLSSPQQALSDAS